MGVLKKSCRRPMPGEALAGFYSIIASLELYGKKPGEYFADVLMKLSNGHPQSRLEELLPWNWESSCKEKKVLEEAYFEESYSTEMLLKKLGIAGDVIIKPRIEPRVSSSSPDPVPP